MRTSRSIVCLTCTLAMAVLAATGSQAAGEKKNAAAAAPKPHNQFITVAEFVKAKRPAGTTVSVEGYFVSVLKTGSSVATCWLVDSTDQVLSASDAKKCAAGGVSCTVKLGGKSNPRWVATRKGLLSLAMYSGTRTPTTCVQDAPPKLRIQGVVGKNRSSLSTVTRIEYQDDSGNWRIFR